MNAVVSKIGYAPVTGETDGIKHRIKHWADGEEYDSDSAIRNIQGQSAPACEQQRDLHVHCRLVSSQRLDRAQCSDPLLWI
jgi:hypothetical protein